MTMVSGILLSMRLFAEERQLNTLTLLLTSPIRDHEIVLGKFLSALVFFLGMTALTIYMPLLIFINGKVSIGHILGGYLGLAMLGMASISVGIFASSVAKNQLIALVLGAGLMVAIYLCYLGASKTEPPIRDLMAFISPQKHLTWQTGLLNSRDIFYYLSMTYFFLLLTIHMIKSRRWR
jgi:ABC-2 type transport system permease protein